MVNPNFVQLIGGLDSEGKPKAAGIDADGNLKTTQGEGGGSVVEISNDTDNPVPTQDAGSEIDGVSIPTGGVGLRGWLSAIWKLVSDRLPVSLGVKNVANSFSIAPASDSIFRQSIRAFRAAANFNRPADTTAYTVLDAITNSTSAPTILSVDLSSFGATNGQFLCITNARVISSAVGGNLPLVNIFIFNKTFTATNDNSQLSIDDATAQTGGITIPCLNTYNLGANSCCVSDPGQWVTQLNAESTTIYFTLQSANVYTPASGETFHVVLEGFLL